jgi:hypothetical protein
MATTSTEAQARTVPGAREQFLQAFEMEHATTMRVLRAYPADQVGLRPHPRSKNALELAWNFAVEDLVTQQALTTGIDWASMGGPPESLDAVIAATEDAHRRVAELVANLPEERLAGGTVQFFVGPKTMGDVPVLQFLWMMLCDQIHHRGQFSVYLRMAGGKVPSIYGPTADEPWN